MRLLLDECVSRLLKRGFAVHGHECLTVSEVGLAGKKNGELLLLAEGKFDVFITIDKNLRYQGLSAFLQELLHAPPAIFGHPRDSIDLNTGLQGRFERHGIHVVEQPFRQHHG